MARRKVRSPAVKMTRWFDHVPSDLVDITPHVDSEFVQVWSAPDGTEDRFVTLSYHRTPNGPTDIDSRVGVEGGPWESIETNGPRRSYYYRGGDHETRYVELLPSGRPLVEDDRQGFTIKSVWSDQFDWKGMKPVGKPLGGFAVEKRKKEGATFFVSCYQQTLANGSLASETLVYVEEYSGDVLVKLEEVLDGNPESRIRIAYQSP